MPIARLNRTADINLLKSRRFKSRFSAKHSSEFLFYFKGFYLTLVHVHWAASNEIIVEIKSQWKKIHTTFSWFRKFWGILLNLDKKFIRCSLYTYACVNRQNTQLAIKIKSITIKYNLTLGCCVQSWRCIFNHCHCDKRQYSFLAKIITCKRNSPVRQSKLYGFSAAYHDHT